MPEYLCLQRPTPTDPHDQPSASDMQELYARFEAWKERFSDNLTDLGGRLGEGHGGVGGSGVYRLSNRRQTAGRFRGGS